MTIANDKTVHNTVSTKSKNDSNTQSGLPNVTKAQTSQKSKEVKRLSPIVYNETCSGTINDSRRTTSFHEYDKVEQYMNGLFGDISDINLLPKEADPVFITGCSSNHFHESIKMFENFNSVVRKMKPSARLIFYDLGLTTDEQQKIKSVCQCEFRRFPFEKFPAHVKTLTGYAFKPLAIMMVLKEYPFALWMDSSVRFKQANISELFDDARRLDLICMAGDGSIARRTLPTTFAYFDEQPCTFRNLSEIQANLLIARTTPFILNNILKPWIACALLIDCMDPHDGPSKYLYCGQHGEVYGECHRFDQSVWGILLYRAYGYDVFKHMQTYGDQYVILQRL